ncbi:hypothetical protein D3C74_288740 [compost metagenome]
MRQKILNSPQPSIRAISIMSFGSVRKNWRMKNTANVPEAPGKIIPQNEFISPLPPLPNRSFPPTSGIWRSTYTLGIIVTIPGTIMETSRMRKNGWFIRKFSLANA